MGGDVRLARRIGRLFIEDYPVTLSRIRKAISKRDAGALQSAAHAIKGSVANFGAPEAVEAAAALESLGRQGKLDQAREILAALTGHLRHLERSLEHLGAKTSASRRSMAGGRKSPGRSAAAKRRRAGRGRS
jgi:HPt (histidine-containing phosphotransfer) domain-containing protein